MAKPKILVAFYSTYGTNHGIADAAAQAAEAAGAEVRLRRFKETAPPEVVAGQDAWAAQVEKASVVAEISHDDMDWADGYFWSVPTRYGQAPSQVRSFIDTLGGLWQQGKLADKAFTATTSSQTPHGGQEATILGLYTTVMHWGAVIVAPGYTNGVIFKTGNPYGFSKTSGSALTEDELTAIKHQAERLVTMTAKLRG